MIEGKVVRIVDERTLIASVGVEHGVEVGQEFVVVQPVDTVVDPDTDEELGTWELVKARVIAVHVQPKITTFMPLPDKQQQATVLSERMAWNSRGAPIGSSDVSLSIDRSQMSGRRRTDVIRIGDPIRSIR